MRHRRFLVDEAKPMTGFYLRIVVNTVTRAGVIRCPKLLIW
jgi:hypothetical protein